MKNFLFSLSVICLFSTCEKKDEGAKSPCQTIIQDNESKIAINHNENNSIHYIVLQFDSNAFLSNQNYQFTYSYNSNGDPIKIDYKVNDTTGVLYLIYNSENKFIGFSSKSDGLDRSFANVEYSYLSNPNLIRINFGAIDLDDSTATPHIFRYSINEIDINKNIIRDSVFSHIDSNYFILEEMNVYSYNDKLNPLNNLIHPFTFNENGGGSINSRNCVTKKLSYNRDGSLNEEDSYNIKYTYNAKGKIDSKILTNFKNRVLNSYKYQYTCD